MGAIMEEMSFHGAKIFLPELFDMNERPLPAAKAKVLYTREL